MIDVHCHVLPALDDGARDVADACEMARVAHADGIRAICATPHIRADHDVDIDGLAARRAALQAALDVDVEILAGGEVAEERLAELSDDELAAVALGGGRWVLLEPARGPLSERLVDAVGHLEARGFGTVVAHPERHYDHAFLERVRALRDRGALIQVTAAYVGEWWMRRLVEAGLVDLVATDAHTSHGGRRVELGPALAAIREYAPDRAEELVVAAPERVAGR